MGGGGGGGFPMSHVDFKNGTVNVDICVLLNFRASSPRCHFHVGLIFAHIVINSV